MEVPQIETSAWHHSCRISRAERKQILDVASTPVLITIKRSRRKFKKEMDTVGIEPTTSRNHLKMRSVRATPVPRAHLLYCRPHSRTGQSRSSSQSLSFLQAILIALPGCNENYVFLFLAISWMGILVSFLRESEIWEKLLNHAAFCTTRNFPSSCLIDS